MKTWARCTVSGDIKSPQRRFLNFVMDQSSTRWYFVGRLCETFVSTKDGNFVINWATTSVSEVLYSVMELYIIIILVSRYAKLDETEAM